MASGNRVTGVAGGRRDLLIACVVMAGSNAGDMAAQAALTLRLHGQVGTGGAISMLLLANTVPALLLAPVTGRLADRVDSRVLVVASGLGCAALCVPLSMADTPAVIFGLMAGLAAVSAVSSTTLSALLPVLVGRDGVVGGTTALRGATMISAVAGMALGSGAAGLVGSGPVLLADGVTFVLLAAGGALIKGRRGGRRHTSAGRPSPRPEHRHARSRALPWALTIGYALVLLLVSTTNVAQVFFIKDELGASDLGYGVISGCWTVGTAVMLPIVRRMAADPDRLARFSILGQAVVAAAILGCAVLPSIPATVLMYVVGGAGTCVMQVARGAFLQLVATPERRGQQLAEYNAVLRAATIGALGLGGLLLGLVDARAVYLIAGAGALTVAAGTGVLLSRSTGKVRTT